MPDFFCKIYYTRLKILYNSTGRVLKNKTGKLKATVKNDGKMP